MVLPPVPRVTLGGLVPGTPPALHFEMEELARAGALPQSTFLQRLRNRRTPGTTYCLPPALIRALHASYLHPDHPSTQRFNYRWRRVSAGIWLMSPKGG